MHCKFRLFSFTVFHTLRLQGKNKAIKVLAGGGYEFNYKKTKFGD